MYVEGMFKDGDDCTRNTPVLVAGVDGSGNVQTLLMGTDGSQTVALAAGTAAIGTVTLAAPLNASTTAYAASLVVKGTPGTLYGLSGYNSLASDQWIQLHDAATLPANTAVPVVIFLAKASANFGIDFGPRGRAFATGIVACNSTTGPTKTIGAANCWIDAQYV